MVTYEFYGDQHILGLSFDSGREVFIDLDDVCRASSADTLAEQDDPMTSVYADRDAIRDLFGANGCLEDCPVE